MAILLVSMQLPKNISFYVVCAVVIFLLAPYAGCTIFPEDENHVERKRHNQTEEQASTSNHVGSPERASEAEPLEQIEQLLAK